MTCECGSRAESKNCENLAFPTADRRFDTKVKCPTGWASFWVKFPTVRSSTRVKCPGIARGGWAVLELTGTLLHTHNALGLGLRRQPSYNHYSFNGHRRPVDKQTNGSKPTTVSGHFLCNNHNADTDRTQRPDGHTDFFVNFDVFK